MSTHPFDRPNDLHNINSIWVSSNKVKPLELFQNNEGNIPVNSVFSGCHTVEKRSITQKLLLLLGLHLRNVIHPFLGAVSG